MKYVKSRDKSQVAPLFGLCTGILVGDRAAVFNFWGMEIRQVCNAHLLGKIVAFSERDV